MKEKPPEEPVSDGKTHFPVITEERAVEIADALLVDDPDSVAMLVELVAGIAPYGDDVLDRQNAAYAFLERAFCHSPEHDRALVTYVKSVTAKGGNTR